MRGVEDLGRRSSGGASASERVSSISAPGGVEDGERMLAAFVACRTTLDDLSGRAAALGEAVSGAVIASHLTGKSDVSDAKHNAVADAINARLSELSLPAAVDHRPDSSPSPPLADGASTSRSRLTRRRPGP